MEASATTLSIESFSYRWLINLKSSFDHDLSSSFEESFIVMDPKTTPSKRFLLQEDHYYHDHTNTKEVDHEFNFPTLLTTPTSYDHQEDFTTTTTTTIVYAEELFSNGLLMPLFLNNNNNNTSSKFSSSDSPTTSDDVIDLEPSTIVVSSLLSTNKTFAKKYYWRSLSKRIIKKYLGFLRPLYHKVQRSPPCRWSTTSTGTRITETTIDARKPLVLTGCDFEEGSIYEAVLHCKKSIGMSDHHVSVFG